MISHQPRMRPSFLVHLEQDGAAVFRCLAESIADPETPLRGEVLDSHAYVRLPRERRSLLSPSMNLELRGEQGRELHGRFVPHPTVWTGFITLFATLGVIAFGALMFGFAQMMTHESPWAFWIAPASLGLAGFIYGAAFIGQGLSNEDMYELRSFLDSVVRDARVTAPPAMPSSSYESPTK